MSVATLQAFGEQLPLDNTIGAMLIGVITSAVLYGVSLGQTLYYFNRYPKDPWYLKWLVGSTLFFDTLHLALISHSVYHYTIIEYYNHHALENVVWSVLAELIPNGLTATFVQLFYVSRVFRLSKKNYWLTGIILVLVLAYAAGGVAWAVITLQMKTFSDVLRITPLTIALNVITVVADLLIAGVLCYILARSRTGFRRTDSLINKLIAFTANTGLATSLCAVSVMISLWTAPKSLAYAPFYFCIGRLYINSLLATLNSRDFLRSDGEDVCTSIPLTPSTNSTVGGGRNQNISIRIETTQTEFNDLDHKSGKMVSEHSDGRSPKNIVLEV